MAIPYIPLLYHSNYGVGGSVFKTLFENLIEYGIESCGIVDETFFGLPEFITYARAYNIKPIIGAQISSLLQRDIKLYLFVKDRRGYENLCRILTEQAFKNLNHEFIKKHSPGLIALSNSAALLEEFSSAFPQSYYLLYPYHTPAREKFPPLAAHEIYYVTKQEKILHKLMCAIKDHRYEHKRGNPHHLLTNSEYNSLFTDYPQAIINNKEFSKVCNYVPKRRAWIFPESKQSLYDVMKPKMKNITRAEKSRIQYEYQIIKETGFEPYFTLVYSLKEFALSKGIGMNVRGSAASSFILYLLGLSVVDPLKYNLPFERFLNPQRTEPPDIDVDVEFIQRQKLIEEIYKKFSSDHVAHISVINHFQRRARFRDTARAYGISPQELKNITFHYGERLIKDIRDVSKQINDYPHYFSCHASGIVITPEPIQKYVPLYPSPAGQITHFDKDGIGLVGLVKIDILGVRGFPSLYLSKDRINFEDQKVYSFIGRAETLGCFQIESPMVRQFLKRIKPKTLMDIANAIAIIRPGPGQGGMRERFLKRLKGEEKISYPHPRLKKALNNTLGIPVYQEQILQIAHDFAQFSLSDADMLRRAMTKERRSNRMEELEKLFFRKTKKLGYSKKESETVWARIRSFSSFGFNKAHSITYATLAYLSAYQKLYKPSEFFCRVINNKGGYYPTHAYVNEARRWGLKILSPDINRSEDAFSIYNTSLITGLNEIKNLSSTVIEQICKFRPFHCAEEFFYCVKLSIDEGISLIKSGAMDTFKQPWPKLYFLLLHSRFKKKSTPSICEKIPDFRDFNSEVKTQSRLEVMDFLPERHILEVFYPDRKTKIAELRTGEKSTIIGALIARRTILAKTNRLMSFLTIDDETGTLEVIIFPNRFKPHFIGPVMQVRGIMKDDSLTADAYTPLSI